MDTLHNTTSSIEDTLAKAMSIKGKHGITRLADITNFSRIDLPVWIGIRPNAKCLSQSAGKGLTSESSMLSALMEGIEVSYAENVETRDAILANARISVVNGCECIDIDDYPTRQMVKAKDELRWIPIEKLDSKNETVYAPYEILSLDFTRHRNEGPGPKKMITTSNGVASGGNITEATVSALLEVVERHSITVKMRMGKQYRKIDLSEYESIHINNVLSRIKKGGGNVMLFDSTVVEGIYTVEAIQWSDDNSIPITHGMGASLSLETAILRAILEANQASTIMLSGSRDDMTKSMYTTVNDSEIMIKKLNSMISTIWSPNQNQNIQMKPQEELEKIKEHLKRYNKQPIYRHIFSKPDDPIAAVKILIPKMEGYHMNGYRPVSEVGKELERSKNREINDTAGVDLAAGGGG